jgi:hypothetical protein
MYWSYILAAIGVTGTFFVGRKVIWAWLVLLVNECLWMIYAVTTKQYGLLDLSYIGRMKMKRLLSQIMRY